MIVPASRSKTFQLGFSVNLLANTHPAVPAPTIIKSYSGSRFRVSLGSAEVSVPPSST